MATFARLAMTVCMGVTSESTKLKGIYYCALYETQGIYYCSLYETQVPSNTVLQNPIQVYIQYFVKSSFSSLVATKDELESWPMLLLMFLTSHNSENKEQKK